jgi:hypothetical protein
MGRNLSVGTSCACEGQVLILGSLLEVGGFEKMAAIRALQQAMGAAARAPNEEFESIRCSMRDCAGRTAQP